jgi:hypothetical protein
MIIAEDQRIRCFNILNKNIIQEGHNDPLMAHLRNIAKNLGHNICFPDPELGKCGLNFSELILRYKQTFTVIASQCTTDHNRLVNMFPYFLKL